jgi:hypothetical protein
MYRNMMLATPRMLRGISVIPGACSGLLSAQVNVFAAHRDLCIKNGRTPDCKYHALCCLQAAVNSHAKVVELLLAAGADRSVPNKDGRTPAAMAKTPELQAQLAGSS